ncbi:hypothetical protein C0992_003217 [Termitomyces sp. T32_za158]|nr:hypothetical protein C0992_003217 [Termitomyces sp. T32_za158]
MDSRTGHLQRREDIIIRQYHHPDDLQFKGQDLQIDSTVGGVRRLFVAPTHQSKGVARKLMATLTSHALDHKLHVLELTTSKYNQTALHFYQKLGWKITGQTNYHGFTLVVLRLKLSVGPR